MTTLYLADLTASLQSDLPLSERISILLLPHPADHRLAELVALGLVVNRLNDTVEPVAEFLNGLVSYLLALVVGHFASLSAMVLHWQPGTLSPNLPEHSGLSRSLPLGASSSGAVSTNTRRASSCAMERL